MALFAVQLVNLPQEQERGAEDPGLLVGREREPGPADALRESRVLRIIELVAAWPPMASRSMTTVRSPSEEA